MIYLFLNDTTMGPYSLASVEELWRQGTVTGFTQCCQEGSDQWLPLASVMAAPVKSGVPAQSQPVTAVASAEIHKKKPGDDEFSSSIASAMTQTMNFGVRFTPALYGEFLALGVPALFLLNGWLNKMKKPV